MSRIVQYSQKKFTSPKIYKHQQLNNANFSDFTHNDYQVFLHLVSKIEKIDNQGKYLNPEQLEREYILTAKEFSIMFNTSLSNCYIILRKAVNKLMKTDINVEGKDFNEVWKINICSSAKFNNSQGSIRIKFTDDIMPYLAQVREKFILYNLKEVSNFGSLYTTRLYELIQEFKRTGWMIKSVIQLREAFAVGNNKLITYKDFKKRTFAHACQEINNNYYMNLSFEEIKEGRRVAAIKFLFTKTTVKEVKNHLTGESSQIYEKPSRITSIKKSNKTQESIKQSNDIIDSQNNNETFKNIGNVLSSLFVK